MESGDTVVNFVALSTTVALSVNGVGLIVVPISARIDCSLSLANKMLPKITLNKYNKYKRQYEKDQQTKTPFDNFHNKKFTRQPN